MAVPADAQGPAQRFLFVGNSFTSFSGGVHNYFEGLVAADEDAPAIAVDDQIIEGSVLADHLPHAPDVVTKGGYDVVILQGDIPWRKTSAEPFLEAARELDALIRDSGARTVFYMTWPYASKDWIDLEGIVQAHRQVGRPSFGAILPTGPP